MSASDLAILLAAAVGAITGIASIINSAITTRQAVKSSEIDMLRQIITTQGEQIKALQDENERLHKEIETLRSEKEELTRRVNRWR